MESKKDIRKAAKSAVAALDIIQKSLQSMAIITAVSGDKAVQEAETVLLFSPLESEPDITPLFDLLADKLLLLPSVEGDELVLKKFGKSMVKGAYGILEPEGSETFTELGKIDVVIVPGVAFTPEGGRLGRGKGYYDRFLHRLASAQGCKTATLIGVRFPCQLFESLPLDPWDIPMDKVISGYYTS